MYVNGTVKFHVGDSVVFVNNIKVLDIETNIKYPIFFWQNIGNN